MSETKRNIIIRFAVIYLLVMLSFVAVLGKVVKVQVFEGEKWRELGKKNKKENIVVEANRGNIYSDENKLMASTIPEYTLYMDFYRKRFPVKNKAADGSYDIIYTYKDTLNKYIDSLSLCLSKTLGDKSAAQYKREFLDGYKKQNRHYRFSNQKVSYVQYQAMLQFPFFRKGQNKSGFHTETRLKRVFPFGSLAKRTIGDIYGESGAGQYGLEKYYNEKLTGQTGICTQQKIAGARIKTNEIDPVDGFDINTTINVEMQDIAEKSLREKLAALDAEEGCAVLMEVKTGEIKAIANLVRNPNGTYGETRNVAFGSVTEPGSTFKVASMIAALEERAIDPADSVDTGNGVYEFYGVPMRDHNHEKGGYHVITAAEAIQYSSNIGISKLINERFKDHPERFVNRLYDMGLNRRIDFEIPGSGHPMIPHPKNETEWRIGDGTRLPWLSIGYNTKIPPIYTLMFFNAIANDGEMIKPVFVKSVSRNGQTLEEFHTEKISTIGTSYSLNRIKPMLEAVVEAGTAQNVKSESFKIAGKTGTVQIGYGSRDHRTVKHQVSFCGYFPADKPLYTCIVVISKPNVGANEVSGGRMAGAVFKEIAEKVYARHAKIPLMENGERRMENDDNPSGNSQFSTLNSQLRFPISKNGNHDDLKRVFSKFNIPVTENGELKMENDRRSSGNSQFSILNSQFIRTNTTNEGVEMKSMRINRNLVPNVENMGAKDAVYLLESMGMKVRLSGIGAVKRQSIAAGEPLVKGKEVVLTLG